MAQTLIGRSHLTQLSLWKWYNTKQRWTETQNEQRWI